MPRTRERAAFELGEFWLETRHDARSPFWLICWFDKRGGQVRRLSTRTADFEQAKTRLAEHFVRRSEWNKERPDQVLITQVLARYYHNHAHALASAKFAKHAITHWDAFWGTDVVSTITESRCEKFVEYLAAGEREGKAHRMSSATVRRVVGVGRAALMRAKRRQELASVPYIPDIKVRKKRLPRAPLAQIAAHLNASASFPWVRKWLIGSICTLARPTAILHLRREQLDFDLRRIDLHPPGAAETNKLYPVIPMTNVAYAWMSGHWTGYWITYKGRPLVSIRMGFESVRDRAGLPRTITPYTYRRTISTELRRRGVQPWETAGIMGHRIAEFATTEEYAIYDPDYLGTAAKTIDAICAELQPLLDFDLLATNFPQKALDTAQPGSKV